MRNLLEVLRDEMYMQTRIVAILKEGPMTIPEIAEKLQCPSHEVTKWIMAMRRYGKLIDLPKGRADDYYQYKLLDDK